MQVLTGLITWLQDKIDTLFGFFGFYTKNYSKYLVYALLLWIATKIFKIKLDFKQGSGHK